MLNLIPSYASDYDYLWSVLTRRNKLIIYLRYAVIILIFTFTIVTRYILGFAYTDIQIYALLLITLFMLICNVSFGFLTRSGVLKNDPESFNLLHFSVLQIITDSASLAVITYFTGGIESPFYIFFVLQMIVESLILTGFAIYILTALIIVCFWIGVFLEYSGIIVHHKFWLFGDITVYDNFNYVLIFSFSFSVIMIVSVLLSNSIVRLHYLRSQQLRESCDKLNAAYANRQKYMINIVGDIRAPLVSIKSCIEDVFRETEEKLDPQIQSRIERALKRNYDALQIIKEIQNITTLKLRAQAKSEIVNLDELLKKIISKNKVQADYLTIRINFLDLSRCSGRIIGDRELLEMAFSNLIGNSVKYTNIGGRIEVVVEDGGNDNEVSVEICDNGIGIPEQDRGKLFREFFRGSNVREKSFEGTGLGLSLVKLIIEQHGGCISFESPSRLADEQGPGTGFRVTLKISPEDK